METSIKDKKKRVKEVEPHTVTIFLVDDDVSYLYPMGFFLQRNTFHKVYCYTSGEECIHNMHLLPDLIVLDFNLNPEKPNTMNGLDVLKEIKRLRPKTKVVILSGRDTLQGVAESLKLGAHSYIIKDLEALSSLKKLIDNICDDINKEH
jgi:DNA-binding NarL/FixJ family response regulator